MLIDPLDLEIKRLVCVAVHKDRTRQNLQTFFEFSMGKSVEVDNGEDAILKISVHLLLNCNKFIITLTFSILGLFKLNFFLHK